MISKVITGYKYVFNYFGQAFEDVSLVFLIPLILVVSIISKYIGDYTRNMRLKRTYTVVDQKEDITTIILKKLYSTTGKKQNKIKSSIIKLLNYVTNQISVFNDYSLKRNRKISLRIIFSLVIILIFILLLFRKQNLWYITLFYFVILMLFILIVLTLIVSISKQFILKELPTAYKLLNSRFVSKSSILDAINASMEDFPKAVKREMRKISNVLNKNDIKEIEDTFKGIETTYNNEYMTVLLLLIQQAHFKGSAEMVKSQFEEVTKDILDEIENKKDLSSVSKMYMIVTLLFIPLMMYVIRKFSISGIGESAIAFYESPIGLGIQILVYLSIVIYIGILLYLEKSV